MKRTAKIEVLGDNAEIHLGNIALIGTGDGTFTVRNNDGDLLSLGSSGNVGTHTGPVITLYGDSTMMHEQSVVFTDPGAVAMAGNNDVTVMTSGDVDVDVLGTYTITYTAYDEHNGKAEKRRTVQVVDRPPAIALIGDSPHIVERFTGFDDPGAIAMDGITADELKGYLTLQLMKLSMHATMTTEGGVLSDYMLNNCALLWKIYEDNYDDWHTVSYTNLAQPPQTKHANLQPVPDDVQDRLIAAFAIEKQINVAVGKDQDPTTVLPKFLEGQNITMLVLEPPDGEELSVPGSLSAGVPSVDWESKKKMFLQSAVCIGNLFVMDGLYLPYRTHIDTEYGTSAPNMVDIYNKMVDVTSDEYAAPNLPTVACLYDDGNGGALRWKDDDFRDSPFTWSAFNEIELDPIHGNEEYSDDSSFKNNAWNALQSMLQGVDHVLFIADDSHAPCVTAEAVLKHIVGGEPFDDGSGVKIAIVKVKPSADWINWAAIDLSGAQQRDDTERVFPNDVRMHYTVSVDSRSIPIAMRVLSDGAVASKQVGYHPNSYKKLFAAAPDTVSRLRNIAKSFSILTWSSNINAKDVIKANGLPVSKEGTAETDAIGTYEIKYTTIDTQQNVSTVVRQVRVIPEMILYGVETMIHEQGSIFTDPGATINGDAVTSSVGVVDVDVPGTYTITYIANDESGYRYEKRRQVEVVDRDPIIALFGDTTMFIDRGTPFSDPGAIAMDGVDPEQFRDLTVEAFTLYATMTRAGGVLCDFMSNHHALFLQCRESDNPDDFWFTTSYADLAQPPQTKHANLGHVPDHIQDRLIAAFGIEKQMDLTVGKFPDVLTALPRFLEGQNITRLVLTPEGLSVPPFWASKEDMFLQSAVCIGEKCYIDGVIIPHEIDLDVTYDHSEPNFMDALDRIVDVTSAEYAIPTDAPTVAYLYDDGNGGALRWKPPDDDGNGNAPLPPFTWSAFNEIELDPIHENEEYSDDSSFKNKAWNALQSMLQGVDHVLFIVDDSHAPCVTAEAVLKHIVCGNKAFSDGSGVAIAIVKVSPAADWIDWVALDLSGAQTRDDTERVFPNDVRVHSTVSLDGRTIPIAMRVLSDGAVASKQVGYHPNSYRKKLFEAAPGTVSRPRNIAKAFSIVKVAPDASQALHAYDIIQATVALNVQSTNNVDTDTAATYEVTYTATDAQGNQATATRTVEVIDPSLAYLATRLNWLNGSDPIQDSTWVAPATLIYEIAQGDTQALNEYARYQPPYEMEITSDDQVQLRSHNMHAYLVIDGTIIPSTNLFNENAHRILIKDAVEQRANGIYWVQDVDVTTSNMGTVHSVWTLQRSAADFYMHGGVISVQEGIYNKNRRFKLVDLNPNINNITGDNLAFENVDN